MYIYLSIDPTLTRNKHHWYRHKNSDNYMYIYVRDTSMCKGMYPLMIHYGQGGPQAHDELLL
jgi:hypothetical protein